jgi:hypothetical protein
VAYIENRNRTGLCVMEQIVADVEDPREAFIRLKNKIANPDEKTARHITLSKEIFF